MSNNQEIWSATLYDGEGNTGPPGHPGDDGSPSPSQAAAINICQFRWNFPQLLNHLHTMTDEKAAMMFRLADLVAQLCNHNPKEELAWLHAYHEDIDGTLRGLICSGDKDDLAKALSFVERAAGL